MPFYDPTEEEVKEIIRNEGSFQINDLETHAFDLGHSKEESSLQSCRAKSGEKEANCIRAATETMLVAHFRDAINIDTLFAKYAHHVSQHASCMRKTSVILVVSWFGNNLTIYQGITCVVLMYRHKKKTCVVLMVCYASNSKLLAINGLTHTIYIFLYIQYKNILYL